jgi:glycosyltransferase involved in cell wall biosynthesis
MLRSEKGIDDLILAAEELRQSLPDILVRVAGDGPLMGELRKLVMDRDLGGTVELLGYVQNLDEFYQALDVYVQPSTDEGFGLAALEAFRFGLPMVAADTGFLSGLLGEGEFGLPVKRDGSFVSRLAKGIREVLGNLPEYQLKSQRGLNHWTGSLSLSQMIQRYKAVYSDVLRPGVCMIAPIVTQSTGGIQRQIYLQSRELSGRGFRIFLLQRRDPDLQTDGHKAREWGHVEFLSTPDLPGGASEPREFSTRIRGAIYVLAGVFHLLRMRHHIDICHAHQLFSPTLIGVFGRTVLGMGLVVKVTASGALGEMRVLGQLPFRRLRLWSFNQIQRVIALTPSMREELLKSGFPSEKVVLIPNCVGGTHDKGPIRLTDHLAPLRILFSGRLSEEKCLDTLVRAVGLLQRRRTRVQVDLVGRPDPDRDISSALRTAVAGLPDPNAVRFHGFQRDVAPFYRAAHVFALPSKSEGLSNSLLEAMSFGLLCIASDIPQNRFVIEHGENGLLFEAGSASSLFDMLQSVAVDLETENGELLSRLSASAKNTVASRFSPDVVGQELETLYKSLLTVEQS